MAPKDMAILSIDPLIGVIDDFCPPDILAELHRDLDVSTMRDASIARQGAANSELFTEPETRTAKARGYPLGTNALIDGLRARATALFHLETDDCENPTVIHYPPGGQFEDHLDSPAIDSEVILKGSIPRPRVFTGVLYLNDDFEGGITRFPRAGIDIAPRAGRLAFWQNLAAGSLKPHPRSLHAGLPVTSGEKTIISFWMTTPLAMDELDRIKDGA